MPCFFFFFIRTYNSSSLPFRKIQLLYSSCDNLVLSYLSSLPSTIPQTLSIAREQTTLSSDRQHGLIWDMESEDLALVLALLCTKLMSLWLSFLLCKLRLTKRFGPFQVKYLIFLQKYLNVKNYLPLLNVNTYCFGLLHDL